ncbi:hypothetical protein GX51_03279 [Blastomyces parvus]|uniref:Uncharacterized protein n=1 Tax=Blastomyces parvus TaxID=2060905 RepID=A0A2B7WZM5_9EURO|nr:hypothetical protein GX51_03279 [Blastomyces parvus]
MKFVTVALVAISLLSSPTSFVLGQEDPGPSPTESVGCEPHGDHWHCDGPRPPTDAPATGTAAPTAADPGPSPTESVGCEPHGDHWHCDGPATALPTATPTHPPDDEHEHEHNQPTASGSSSQDPGPSPTESVGCEPHGDHWHCDGPATATTTGATPAPTTGGAGANVFRLSQCAGVAGAAVVVAMMM